jgi:hypothetical protein
VLPAETSRSDCRRLNLLLNRVLRIASSTLSRYCELGAVETKSGHAQPTLRNSSEQRPARTAFIPIRGRCEEPGEAGHPLTSWRDVDGRTLLMGTEPIKEKRSAALQSGEADLGSQATRRKSEAGTKNAAKVEQAQLE